MKGIIKMEKVNEGKIFDSYFKAYKNEGLSVIDVLEMLEANQVQVNNIKFKEDAESDMQTINNTSYNSAKEFLNDSTAISQGIGVTCIIKCSLNGQNNDVTVGQNAIILNTPDANMEIDDLLSIKQL